MCNGGVMSSDRQSRNKNTNTYGPAPASSRNLLLAALPEQDRVRLVAESELVVLEKSHVLHEESSSLSHVHFPLDSVVSLVVRMENGAGSEVGLVGRDGLLGLPLFFGIGTNEVECVVQRSGEALRLPRSVFECEIARDGALSRIIGRYAHGFVTLVALSAACNALHPVEQRLSRWILMQHDRASNDVLPLTQEFLALMLGVQRTTVNQTARVLQEAGLIRHSRGLIDVLDREGLEHAACECYGRIRGRMDAMVGGMG